MEVRDNMASVANGEGEIIDEICDYAEKYEIRQMMQEYMRRLILEQPKEPLKWLIKEITDNPYTPKQTEEPVAETAAVAPADATAAAAN